LCAAGTWTLREVEGIRGKCPHVVLEKVGEDQCKKCSVVNNATLLGEFPKILILPEMKLGSRNIVASLVSRLWNKRSGVGIFAV